MPTCSKQINLRGSEIQWTTRYVTLELEQKNVQKVLIQHVNSSSHYTVLWLCSPTAGTGTRARLSEDKASVHGRCSTNWAKRRQLLLLAYVYMFRCTVPLSLWIFTSTWETAAHWKKLHFPECLLTWLPVLSFPTVRPDPGSDPWPPWPLTSDPGLRLWVTSGLTQRQEK